MRSFKFFLIFIFANFALAKDFASGMFLGISGGQNSQNIKGEKIGFPQIDKKATEYGLIIGVIQENARSYLSYSYQPKVKINQQFSASQKYQIPYKVDVDGYGTTTRYNDYTRNISGDIDYSFDAHRLIFGVDAMGQIVGSLRGFFGIFFGFAYSKFQADMQAKITTTENQDEQNLEQNLHNEGEVAYLFGARAGLAYNISKSNIIELGYKYEFDLYTSNCYSCSQMESYTHGAYFSYSYVFWFCLILIKF